MIGLISATRAGATARDRLAAALPGRCRVYDGPVREAIGRAFGECEQLVCFLATGATVRVLAPLLSDKANDPGVVCVDEGLQHVVALTGGHGGGANALAQQVADVFPGSCPVITTASDAVGLPGLDQLGWPVSGAVAAVSRAVLDGDGVTLRADAVWPLPALPGNVRPADEASAHADPTPGRHDTPHRHQILVTDKDADRCSHTVALHPPSLVVGVGASSGAPADEVIGLIEETLSGNRLTRRSVTALATVDAKAAEPGLLAAAEHLGVPLLTHSAEALAAIAVPNPSAAPLAAVGTPSVAEAAALAQAGAGAELAVPKQKSAPEGRPAMATCAIARRRPRGRLTVIGLGPGARDLLTPRARDELRRSSVVVGLDQYVDQIRDLLRPGTRVLESGLGAEEERARTAVAEARAGHAVALIGSGDAGVYAMASPALVAADTTADFDVVGVPGVTAALAAAALLGAPLGHDHASISLSDLHTPWEVIEQRVRAAAAGDFVVTFYNPRSRGRDWQLPKALGLLAEHRSPGTPVGVVRNASRPGESCRVTTLGELAPETVDMMSVVVVGNSATRVAGGRMVTPRGYRWQV
ncbi:precorrin-3B C(17)-methyltransferase [Streptomyces sp. A7024]|uniref:Precorrin-3B C(17)-methyltransferase n=1 Tax=Streptomyces coryli TaxID=1128680 RepID=A0A6G4U9E6_9ACTN|nr:precorrin-3B C(17)-methyltransferase [Streptomyces coryli]NGN67937.1 precorrin-3B C(17)-methyltransferase [Streptomyces coryli]